MKFFGALCILVASTFCAWAVPLKVEFRHPHRATFEIDQAKAKSGEPWIEAVPSGTTNRVELGARVVIHVDLGENLAKSLRGRSLKKSRQITPTLFILQAADALTAIREAEIIAKLPHVLACYPVTRHEAVLDGAFAPFPNDNYFHRFVVTGTNGSGIWGQWNLENRTPQGIQMGPDIAIRSAWPYSRGEGITVAVADSGIETTHPELSRSTAGAPHFNFANSTTNINPTDGSSTWAHGTLVGGIIAAEANNARGLAGVAHNSKLAGWVILHTNTLLVGEEQLMDLYQYRSNVVSVQNHSWGKGGVGILRPMGLLESIGFSNAIFSGRGGLGSILVRAAGNRRTESFSPDDRGETANPWAITVAAARIDGRVASYSEPGTSVLVAAPSGDFDFPYLFSSDLVGTRGQNQFGFFPPYQDLSDYGFNSLGFSGTSGSAPQISGIAALLLSVNPTLTYRDVQQIFLHSGKHWDQLDPDLKTNSAGLPVSHNLGYGIPDAGEAVRLASTWQNRPALTRISILSTNETPVPDAGLRVLISGENLPPLLSSIIAYPTQRGPQPDVSTSHLPLVDVGTASSPIAQDLTGRGAVTVRDATAFATKIDFAAAAGAPFVILCNNSTNPFFAMAATDFVKIPAVLIPKVEGDLLRTYMSTNAAAAHLALNSATYSFSVSNTLSCEHVGVRVKSNHPQRGDLRVTLASPGGTRSILQTLNSDSQAFPGSWTYISTHHFYESCAGTWTVAITDEFRGGEGAVQEVELIVWGTSIVDSDYDGLPDDWEFSHFGTLSSNPTSDPDTDGYNNAREYILGTNPLVANAPLIINLSRFNNSYYRAGWPSSTHFDYEVWSGTNVNSLMLMTIVPGKFPESDWILPATNAAQFVRILQKPK